MKGWLIVNEFLNYGKYKVLHNWLLEAAIKKNVELIMKTNAEVLTEVLPKDSIEELPDFVLFWDKDIRLAQWLELLEIPVFNSSKAIEICDDKSLTYLVLKKGNIPMPKTIIGPKTFENIGYNHLEFLEHVEQQLGYPFVLKECHGSFGQQVYLVHSKEEVMKQINLIGPKPILFQEFIANSNGRDVRVQVVGNKVVASMYRYSENGDFRANISNGGKMKQNIVTKEQERLALECCKRIGLDFAGVDLLYGESEKPIVCEVNSNAHFKNIYDCTGVNVAELILEYIIAKIEN